MIVVFLSEWRKLNMALVGIVMGSDSDMPVMAIVICLVRLTLS